MEIKEKKQKKFFRDNYIQCWDYLKESKDFIYIIIIIFFIFTLMGFFIPAPSAISEQILKFIQELVEKTQGMSQIELIKFIFLNNLQSSFFGMIFGALLGVFPVIAALTNGYLLGFVASMNVANEKFWILLKILPYGIFELPAIFISLGLGLKFGTFIFQKRKAESFKRYLWNSLKVFLLIIIPLLIIAGIIEGSLIFYQNN